MRRFPQNAYKSNLQTFYIVLVGETENPCATDGTGILITFELQEEKLQHRIFILLIREVCGIIVLSYFSAIWMVIEMAVSYKKLWKLLIDLDMKKKDLQQAAGVSPALIAKLGRNENVSTESLVKICTALHCDIGDIIEIVPVERLGE